MVSKIFHLRWARQSATLNITTTEYGFKFVVNEPSLQIHYSPNSDTTVSSDVQLITTKLTQATLTTVFITQFKVNHEHGDNRSTLSQFGLDVLQDDNARNATEADSIVMCETLMNFLEKSKLYMEVGQITQNFLNRPLQHLFLNFTTMSAARTSHI
jgi:hypothetical protein